MKAKHGREPIALRFEAKLVTPSVVRQQRLDGFVAELWTRVGWGKARSVAVMEAPLG